jgi:hypothetical protein
VIKYHGSEGQRGFEGRYDRTSSGEAGTLFVGELHTLLSRFVSEGRISDERVLSADYNGRSLAGSEREVATGSGTLSGRSGFGLISRSVLEVRGSGRGKCRSRRLRDYGDDSENSRLPHLPNGHSRSLRTRDRAED